MEAFCKTLVTREVWFWKNHSDSTIQISNDNSGGQAMSGK